MVKLTDSLTHVMDKRQTNPRKLLVYITRN